MEEASAFKTWFQPGPRPARDAVNRGGGGVYQSRDHSTLSLIKPKALNPNPFVQTLHRILAGFWSHWGGGGQQWWQDALSIDRCPSISRCTYKSTILNLGTLPLPNLT